MIDKLTIFFPYYNQPTALINQLEIMSNYNEEIRKKISIFIVDDGSTKEECKLAILQKYLDKLEITLYRIDIDIPWNMPETNNLAFRYIETDYVIRLDIDHYLDSEEIAKILDLNPKQNICYKFRRKDPKGNPNPRNSVNSYLINKKDYWLNKGYNEFFSGHYGNDDIDFFNRMDNVCKVILLENIFLTIVLEHLTINLDRDTTINIKKLHRKNNPHYTFQHEDKYIHLL